MKYTPADITHILNLSDYLSDASSVIHYICVDTRLIVRASSTLFIALPGKHKDGHDFIPLAYERGVRHFITDRPIALPDAYVYQVKDTLNALQLIAKAHRNQFDIPVIGITGSNGKTTVKEWLYQLVSTQFVTHKSPLSYNSQIGVPLSIFGMTSDHEVAILEAGISQMDEMQRLSNMINCSIGVFTTLGDSHSAGFNSDIIKLKEKIKLFESAHTIIYNLDQDIVHQTITDTYPDKKLITTSLYSDQADVYIYKENTSIKLKYKNNYYTLPLAHADDISLQNIASCIAAAIAINIIIEDALHPIANIGRVKMRLQLDQGANGSIIINDGYNADLQSFESALEFMQSHAGDRTRKLVITEFAELGNQENVLIKLSELINAFSISEIYAIGKLIEPLRQLLDSNIIFHHFDSTQSLISSGDLFTRSNDIILLKGARSFHLEDIHRHISVKMHRTIMEIDLEAIGHNLSCHAQLLNSETRIMVMVKASAYGSGIEEISKYLELKQVDYFGVAFIDEGLILRKAGITKPIMVLSPVIDNLDQMIRHQLEPSINSIKDFHLLHELLPPDQKLNIHINIDTGMNRMGINPAELEKLIATISKGNVIRVKSLYTHLAASDDLTQRDFTLDQIEAFNGSADQICAHLSYQPLRHVLNSEGIIHYPDFQMDMVRLGIGLYGIKDTQIKKERLIPAHTLKSHISHIQNIHIGESVGYNRSWIATKPTRVATVQIGYADGLPRNSGHLGYQLSVHGKLAPIIGHVCMDLTMIDITDLPEVKIGDEVIIYGKGRPISELASINQTISYEILSHTSDRVKRIYLR